MLLLLLSLILFFPPHTFWFIVKGLMYMQLQQTPFFSHKEYYNKVECVSIPLLLRNRTINNGKDEALNLAGGITRLYCWTPQGLANTHLLTPRNAIDTQFIARGKKYPRNKA